MFTTRKELWLNVQVAISFGTVNWSFFNRFILITRKNAQHGYSLLGLNNVELACMNKGEVIGGSGGAPVIGGSGGAPVIGGAAGPQL